MSDPTTLRPDHTLDEVAKSLRMSTRWVREQIKNGAEHTRRGHKIMFTDAQVEKLRAAHSNAPAAAPLTTGRKKRTA